jgi:hypothetical protein
MLLVSTKPNTGNGPDLSKARILWLTSARIESAIQGGCIRTAPAYIQETFERAAGRPEKGNFFCASELDKFNPRIYRTGDAADEISACHGILVLAQDAAILGNLPGLWTDMNLNRIENIKA